MKWSERIKQLMGKAPSPPAPPASEPLRTAAEVFEASLQKLGTQFTKEESEENYLYKFTYQGGHFQLPLPRTNIGTATLEFPFILTVPVEQVEVLRTCCNKFNLACRLSKFVYTFDESDNSYGVHIFTPLILVDGMPGHAGYLGAVLESLFELRREFTHTFEKTAPRAKNNDVEQDSSYSHRVNYLLREQEISHQAEAFQLRRSQSASLQLSEMIDLCFGLHDVNFAYVKIVDDETVKFEFDQETISHLDLKAIPTDTTYFIYFNDSNSMEGSLRMLQITMTRELDDDVATYLRLSTILYPSNYGPNSTFVSGHTGLDALTFLVAVDKQDEQSHRVEYDYVWEDALDKQQKSQKDQLTEEQKLLLDADSPNVGYYLFRGRRLFANARYYEAIDFLTHAFFYLNDEYDFLSNTQRNAFREISFLIGFCYMELQLFAEAYYFLDIVHDLNNIRYAQEYINCMVNSNDYRAAEIVENMISFVTNFMMRSEEDEDDDNEVPQSVTDFYHFLRRRRVYLMINNEQFQEAEQECKSMLNEPANADFALDELAYIQKLRRTSPSIPPPDASSDVSSDSSSDASSFIDELPF